MDITQFACGFASSFPLGLPDHFSFKVHFLAEDLAGSRIDQMKILVSHALAQLQRSRRFFGEPLLQALGHVRTSIYTKGSMANISGSNRTAN